MSFTGFTGSPVTDLYVLAIALSEVFRFRELSAGKPEKYLTRCKHPGRNLSFLRWRFPSPSGQATGRVTLNIHPVCLARIISCEINSPRKRRPRWPQLQRDMQIYLIEDDPSSLTINVNAVLFELAIRRSQESCQLRWPDSSRRREHLPPTSLIR
jgi:hypothetical protein